MAAAGKRSHSSKKRTRFQPAFTAAGGVFLLAALVIFIRSALARNAYEIMLSLSALLFMLVLGIIGVWKSHKLAAVNPGWKLPFPMTANSGEKSYVSGLEEYIPLFFRLHFVVHGRFFPSGASENLKPERGGCPVFAQVSVPRGNNSAYLRLDFPISGIFHGEGFCRLRDVFGFYSFSCETPQRRIAKVRSAPCFGKNIHINAQSGAEDRRSKTTSDEERYYMREYTPGDRFRDINWKSSEKIDALITRISPDNQEKVSRIEVYLRNYGTSVRPPLESLWMLDRAKARLSWFLRSLLDTDNKTSSLSSFIFSVYAAGGSWEIEDSESLDAFLEDLAGLPFSPPQNETNVINHASAGELYVFSTACDTGLNGFILACSPRPVSLFLAQPAGKKKQSETETLGKLSFAAKGIVPFPRWFTGSNKVKEMGANAAKVEMIYTETKL
jgi:hypothetical protein